MAYIVYVHHEGLPMKVRDYLPSEPCVCINLRRIGLKITDLYDKALKPIGLTATQYSLLINIGHMEGCGTGELAKRVNLERSTLVRTLHPLFQKGLIIDKASGKRRRRNLYLTSDGEDILKKAYPLWLEVKEEALRRLGMSYEDLLKFFEGVNL